MGARGRGHRNLRREAVRTTQPSICESARRIIPFVPARVFASRPESLFSLRRARRVCSQPEGTGHEM